MSSFSLKAGLTPLTTLCIKSNDLTAIENDLAAKAKQAPKMFVRLPCILDFSELDQPIPLATLTLICRDYGLSPIGVKHAQTEHKKMLEALSLTDFGSSSRSPRADISAPNEVKSTTVSPVPALNAPVTHYKFPVRSGQQLHAEGDLIISGLVSAGAEVLAGGSIHVYGPLRGRALAGIHGNRHATISCQSLEAELVSIAGEYKLLENADDAHKQGCLVQLQDGSLNIDAL